MELLASSRDCVTFETLTGAHERERGERKRRLIEYGRFSLVDKADNQLVKMLMHSPVVMPASRPRVFTSFRSVPTGQKLSAGSNRLIYLF